MMDKWIDRERDEFVVIVVNIFAPLKRWWLTKRRQRR